MRAQTPEENKKAWTKLLDALCKELRSQYETGRIKEKVSVITLGYHMGFFDDKFIVEKSPDIQKNLEEAKAGQRWLSIYKEGEAWEYLLYKWSSYSLYNDCKRIETQEDFADIMGGIKNLKSFQELPVTSSVIVRQVYSYMDSSKRYPDEILLHIIEGLDDTKPIPQYTLSRKEKAIFEALKASDTYAEIAALWKQWDAKTGSSATPGTGVSPAAIMLFEKVHKIQLPDDLKASLLLRGATNDSALFGAFDLLDMEGIKSEYDTWLELLKNGDFKASNKLVKSSTGVKKTWYDKGWLPITTDGSGNNHCIDFSPTKDGQKGQIILLLHDDEKREVVADSFTDLLIRALKE